MIRPDEILSAFSNYRDVAPVETKVVGPGAFSRFDVDLFTATPVVRNFRGARLHYLKHDSAPGGVVDLVIDGAEVTMTPGMVIRGNFTNIVAKPNLRYSAMAGFARFMIMADPAADLFEPDSIPYIRPVNLLGNDSTLANYPFISGGVSYGANDPTDPVQYPPDAQPGGASSSWADVTGWRKLKVIVGPIPELPQDFESCTVVPWFAPRYLVGSNFRRVPKTSDGSLNYAQRVEDAIFTVANDATYSPNKWNVKILELSGAPGFLTFQVLDLMPVTETSIRICLEGIE